MADKLKICDPESIKLRDQGRKEYEEQEQKRLERELGKDISCPNCKLTDPDCDGPKIMYVYDDSISWECPLDECPCCREVLFNSEFKTDMKGIVIS